MYLVYVVKCCSSKGPKKKDKNISSNISKNK